MKSGSFDSLSFLCLFILILMKNCDFRFCRDLVVACPLTGVDDVVVNFSG